MACWSTKASKSLKRVNTEEKLPWRAYKGLSTLSQKSARICRRKVRLSQKSAIAVVSPFSATVALFCNSRTCLFATVWTGLKNSSALFRTVPSPTLYGLLFPKIGGSQPPPKSPIVIISGTGKATDFKSWPVHLHGPSEQNSIANFGEKGAWAYPGTAQFLNTPYYPRNA